MKKKSKKQKKDEKNQDIRPFPSQTPLFFSIVAVVPSDLAVSRSRTQLRRRSAAGSSSYDCCKVVKRHLGKGFDFDPGAGVCGHLTVKTRSRTGKLQAHVLTLEKGH